MFWCASSTDDDDPDLKEAKWLSITIKSPHEQAFWT